MMGINSLIELDLVDRVLLWITPTASQPDKPYLRKVSIKMVHLFTVVQLLCLVVLYVIKSLKTVSIIFPVMIIAIVLIRKLLEFIYSKEELRFLDH